MFDKFVESIRQKADAAISESQSDSDVKARPHKHESLHLSDNRTVELKDFKVLAEQAIIVKYLNSLPERTAAEVAFINKIEAIELSKSDRTIVLQIAEAVLLEQDLDYYTIEVDLDVYGEGISIEEHESKVTLQYKIEIEYKSWGINGVNVYDFQPITVTILLEGETEERTVNVDLAEVETTTVPGNIIAPEMVILTLDKELKVIKKEINVMMLGS